MSESEESLSSKYRRAIPPWLRFFVALLAAFYAAVGVMITLVAYLKQRGSKVPKPFEFLSVLSDRFGIESLTTAVALAVGLTGVAIGAWIVHLRDRSDSPWRDPRRRP